MSFTPIGTPMWPWRLQTKPRSKLGVSSVGYGTTSPHSAKRFLHQVKPGQFHVEPTVVTVVIYVVPELVEDVAEADVAEMVEVVAEVVNHKTPGLATIVA